MVLRAPAGGGQAAGTAGASWHGQIFVRLNQDGGAQTVTREGGLTLRMGATRVLEVSLEDTVAMVKETTRRLPSVACRETAPLTRSPGVGAVRRLPRLLRGLPPKEQLLLPLMSLHRPPLRQRRRQRLQFFSAPRRRQIPPRANKTQGTSK